VEKYCKVGLAADDIMAHTHCMLDTQGYKHTPGIYDYINKQQSLHVRISLLKIKVKCAPCTDTEALYRPYGP